VWCAEKGVTLRGGHTLAGAASGDVAVVDLLEPDEDGAEEVAHLRTRRQLQEATFVMDQHFASDFLLLDGRTPNLDAVHFIRHRKTVRAFLREQLGYWASTSMNRFRGNGIKSGDVMFVRSGGDLELAEVVSVSGVEFRAVLLERARFRSVKSVAVGNTVFAKRRDSSGITYNWQSGTVTVRPRNKRKVTVERPSGLADKKISIHEDCLRVFDTERRVWRDGDSWTAQNAEAI